MLDTLMIVFRVLRLLFYMGSLVSFVIAGRYTKSSWENAITFGLLLGLAALSI